MCGTCKIVNFSWLLFAALMIGQNLLTKKHPFKMEFKYILSHKRPFRRFMHSLCKNENILMCGKAHCQFVVCCWFSSLLREVFLRVVRFSPLLKNQHFQIPIDTEKPREGRAN